MRKRKSEQEQVTEIFVLNSSNATFSLKNGFLSLSVTKGEQIKELNRVFLHRSFPFEKLWEYISVLDEELSEVGMISNINDFDQKTAELLKTELERKYYEPRIKTIVSQKERYGFSYWNVITADERRQSFTMQDTFRNIIRVGTDKAILLDVDGNRFVIDSIEALDKKSRKKMELYL